MCANKKLSLNGNYNLVCGILARYIAPKGNVIPLRYIHVKKIFPNLSGIRREYNGEIGHWLNIPDGLDLNEYQLEARRTAGTLPEYTMPKKGVL